MPDVNMFIMEEKNNVKDVKYSICSAVKTKALVKSVLTYDYLTSVQGL